MFNTLSSLTGRRRRTVIWCWLIAVVCAVPASMAVADRLTAGGYEVPGSQSLAVQKTIERSYPQLGAESFVVVLRGERGAGPQAMSAALDRTTHELGAFAPAATVDPSAVRRARQEIAGGRDVVALAVRTTWSWSSAIDHTPALRTALAAGTPRNGVSTLLAGRGAQAHALQEASKTSLQEAEAFGFPVLLLLLYLVFGSLLAAVLPLLLAGAALVLTGAVLFALTQFTDISVFSQNMASMIGVGVAVDYALFVLVRFREEVASGASLDAARSVALRTSGAAAAVSGVTVALSLACLLVVGNGALRSMALGAIVVVLIAVAATITLLPALIAVAGARLTRHRLRRDANTRAPAAFWGRWTNAVMRRPLLTATASAAVLLVLCSPLLSIKTGDDTLRQLSASDDTRVAATLAARTLGAGADAPIAVVARWPDATSSPDRAAFTARVERALRATPTVRGISEPINAADGTSTVFVVTAGAEYESPAGRAAVRGLRTVAAGLEDSGPASLAVGGAGASGVDLIDLVTGKLPLLVGLILLCAYAVLATALRSVVLPVKAVATNLLSVGAGLGVVVALFQWGWFSGLTGIESIGHVQVMALPLIVAVVFGLSMDYQVFLLTRIRERWLDTADSRRAVSEGLSSTASVITSAALVMIVVFVAFAATGVQIVQQLGVGCAVAIAIDATLVRLVLVPSTMALLGRWNWWWPGDRGLPPAGDASGGPTMSADVEAQPAGSEA